MRYVAFLRGINVGGHVIIKMVDLKRMFESFGVEEVQTYIQTGNVIFAREREARGPLETRLEQQLEETAGRKIQLFVRTIREVQAIARNCPFTPKPEETVFVVLLKKKPDETQKQSILSLNSDADQFAVRGREIYHLRLDRERSVFSNNLLEKMLRSPATTRNLTTIHHIVEKY